MTLDREVQTRSVERSARNFRLWVAVYTGGFKLLVILDAYSLSVILGPSRDPGTSSEDKSMLEHIFDSLIIEPGTTVSAASRR